MVVNDLERSRQYQDFDTESDAAAAIRALDGTVVEGSRLTVERARNESSRGGESVI
jgi:RNA recognition motif-containing protein